MAVFISGELNDQALAEYRGLDAPHETAGDQTYRTPRVTLELLVRYSDLINRRNAGDIFVDEAVLAIAPGKNGIGGSNGRV